MYKLLEILKDQTPLLAFITAVGAVITNLITRQGNKHHISSIISDLKKNYEKVVFIIKDANREIDKLVVELIEFKKSEELEELKGNICDPFEKNRNVSGILYDKKYQNYQKVRLFYEALGCYVERNRGLFKSVFILFTFFDEFWRKNEIVMRTLQELNWSISDYCCSSQKLYNRYKKARNKKNEKDFFPVSLLKGLKTRYQK